MSENTAYSTERIGIGHNDKIKTFDIPLGGEMVTVRVDESYLASRLSSFLNSKHIPGLSSVSTAAAIGFTYKDVHKSLGHYSPERMEANINIIEVVRRVEKSEVDKKPEGLFSVSSASEGYHLNFALNTVWRKQCELIFETVKPLVDENKWRKELVATYVAPMVTTGVSISKFVATTSEIPGFLSQDATVMTGLYGLAGMLLVDFAANALVNRFIKNKIGNGDKLWKSLIVEKMNPSPFSIVTKTDREDISLFGGSH